MDGWTDKQMKGRTDRRTDGWKDGRTEGWTSGNSPVFYRTSALWGRCPKKDKSRTELGKSDEDIVDLR